MSHFRYYQALADEAITKHLLHENKCLVKMFCGTGKSKLMLETHINKDKELIVYVFPSLALIEQFYNDYLTDANVLRISSEKDSTTDPQVIKKFLTKKKKIICVTYNSFKTLIDNLNGHKIQVCHYDEAHHAVGETYQRLIFDNDCEKQIFYTATPKNANGIIMYDSDKPETGMCGKMVYDYSYLSGVNEGYLNPIEIRIDMYLKNENRSVFESIARAVLATGNNRVLTFHSDVNTDRDTSVNNFVNEEEFIKVFKEVQEKEFPKVKKYKKIMMVGLSASLKGKQRSEILKRFEKSGSDVMVISSCETIGEGIDTKNANMCVFVDPKTSYVKIIQNIGRIVRKIFGEEKPNSTVLIPCWVDKEKYLGCGGDKEKCDEVIRQDMSEGGNFNGILNVLSALKQEDEEIYDLCLHYPDTYSPKEIENHLEQHGYIIGEPGELNEVLEDLLDTELESDELMDIAEDEDVCIEVYTHSLENPVETYNPEAEEIVRVYQTEEGEYCPVTKRLDKEKRTSDRIPHPNREHRVNLKVHTHPDIKVLWNITSDITGDICSCVIDCEVVKYDPMEAAICIVERAKERIANGGKLLPRNISKGYRNTEELEQEYKDAKKLGRWKQSLKGKGTTNCSHELCEYLDKYLPKWRSDRDEIAMEEAINIVERANKRLENGEKIIPRHIQDKIKRTTEELEQENKDATKLCNWKGALKGKGSNCSNEVRDYLDKYLPGWRNEIDLDEKAIKHAEGIVERAKKRVENGERMLPRDIDKSKQNTEGLKQEHSDSIKLRSWKNALKGKNDSRCSDQVRDYLDENLPGWRTELDFDEKAMKDAECIVERAKTRCLNGMNLIPRNIPNKKNRNTEELEQENKDATKLNGYKYTLKGKGGGRCSAQVRDYLDKYLPGWRTERELDEKAMKDAEGIVERAKERVANGERMIPRQMGKEIRLGFEQEYKDAIKINVWKMALKGKGDNRCCYEVRDYLDKELPGWRIERNFDEKAMKDAEGIVERAKERFKKGEKMIPSQKTKRTTEELKQEHKDAIKLCNWKNILKGTGDGICSDEVRNYLDENLSGWRTETNLDEEAMKNAEGIVERANERVKKGERMLPRQMTNRITEELEQEYNDAGKLGRWKMALKGLYKWRCPDQVRDYLDKELPGWRTETKSMNAKEPKEPKVQKESTEQKRERVHSELSDLHQKYKTLTSDNLRKLFADDPSLWLTYHSISEENEKSFPEDGIPRNRIIRELNKIKTNRQRVVIDMGCGKAQISEFFKTDTRFKFINYDHIKSNETVISCDISRIPLDDDSVEICILSLAMWGSNCKSYISEAYRVLESGGKLYMIEPTKRWTETTNADRLKTLLHESGFKIIEESIEKFCLFECIKK
jgi:superfamily II DNA or RNA helicase/predicted ABC-type ATPase